MASRVGPTVADPSQGAVQLRAENQTRGLPLGASGSVLHRNIRNLFAFLPANELLIFSIRVNL